MNILIVGSTSQIARSITMCAEDEKHTVWEFSRSLGNLDNFICMKGIDLIINCVGNGKPSKAYDLTLYDVLDYDTIDMTCMAYSVEKGIPYIYINSTAAELDVEEKKTNYGIYKRFFEMRHQLIEHPIYDIRISAFFSRFMDLDSGFLISTIIKNHIEGKDTDIWNNSPLMITYPKPLWDRIKDLYETGGRNVILFNNLYTPDFLEHNITEHIDGKTSEFSDLFREELSALLEKHYAERPDSRPVKTVLPEEQKAE